MSRTHRTLALSLHPSIVHRLELSAHPLGKTAAELAAETIAAALGKTAAELAAETVAAAFRPPLPRPLHVNSDPSFAGWL